MSAISSICPKCGSSNVFGPTFVVTSKGEALKYRCVRCGFCQFGPTKDKARHG